MVSNLKTVVGSMLSAAIVVIFAVSFAAAQTISSPAAQEEVATAATSSTSSAEKANAPVFKDYRGVAIGMSTEEVRAKLDRLNKGKAQDFLVLSEHESAQIYYDAQGKVIAVSIDYLGGDAPDPNAVLGVALEAKADGSMYQLNRYPNQGYWVSYNRTAGEKPIVTITMQKM
ncbi:MAG TPA: hypothetical protein VFS77_09485 [Pyrinomonadaceae bacterium]|nr:hypothetical protein [Pyrinomonadaceae bacterium]